MEIKEITTFTENDITKTKMVISENGKNTEIILEGDGKIRTAVEV